MRFLVGLVLLAALSPGLGAARASDKAFPAGTVLGKDNCSLAVDLLPAEILRHYCSGDYVNPIIDWPLGAYKWAPHFLEATRANGGRYLINGDGTVVDIQSRTQPPLIYGMPFPGIDPKDPTAGTQVMWNYQYQYWNEGSSHNVVLLSWVNPQGRDREAIQDVRFLFYDGQDPAYRIANPNNFSAQFVAVATSPADLNGTAALTWRFRDANKRDSNWVFVPALRRVRAVSPANRSDGFLGSDMSQDDGPFFDGKLEDFTWKLTGESDMLRLVDPLSFAGKGEHVPLATGGWRSVWPNIPTAGFQDPGWQGLAWAPVSAALAQRPCWIVEGVPKDRYYLFGKLQLYIDKETYQGAWSRKFGWNGELLNTLQVVAYQKTELRRADGQSDYLWRSNFAYQCSENVKMNRATLAGLLPKGKDVANDRRVSYEASFFDSSMLQRFGK